MNGIDGAGSLAASTRDRRIRGAARWRRRHKGSDPGRKVNPVSTGTSLEAVRPLATVSHGRLPPQNLDAERSVLGGILLDNVAINDVLEILRAGDFYREAHRKVFEAMCALSVRGEPIDRVTLKNELVALSAYEQAGGEDFIDLLDKIVPSASNLSYYARIVHEKAIARRLIEAAHAIAAQGYEQHGEVGEFLDDAERRIFAITEEKAQASFVHVRDVVKSTFKTIEMLYERQEEITGVSTGFVDLDRLTSGFQPGDLVILAARPSMGKAQPLDAPVLTPSGYVAMRDIRAGSSVIGLDGKAHRVLAVFPQGQRPVHRVRLSDGASVECPGSVKSLSEIRTSLRMSGGEQGALDHRVPLVAPVEFAVNDRPLPVAPYLLGLLLGDGGFGNVASQDTVSVDGIAAAVPRGASHKSATRLALEGYGLTSREKFIPGEYLLAGVPERLDLLRGLFDTDGSVTVPAGLTLEFTTSSSLGISCFAQTSGFFTFWSPALKSVLGGGGSPP